MNDFLTFKQLKELTGYKTSSAVERCLKAQGIPVMYGKDGPFTLVEAFRNALGLTASNDELPEKERIEF